MSKIDYQALREAAVAIETVATPQKLLAFRMKVTPQVVLALLDERERNQQYIKRRDQENEDIALTVGKLRVELEAAKSKQPISVVPEGLVRAVRFYEQVRRESPPVETGAWKDAVDWVLKEAFQVVNTGTKGG
ncbi:TPA: ead/Ea22-like family protein [Escherichia coli]|nr:ead/Ea22-like family protein [Escherichia coli]MBF5462110.1 ead/Ea22-like family protein [Escherichia coli]MBF5508210.1 ead/Ea22-like family protein [Escherichia coli]MBF5931809.1 ead/Ea22-like family protein [Escherichia coli]HDQ0676410.1 ead/Ea22-like family protein [Escherichia coli]HEA6357036.1 ead/Ea22-like family protein [Escherichia coli]